MQTQKYCLTAVEIKHATKAFADKEVISRVSMLMFVPNKWHIKSQHERFEPSNDQYLLQFILCNAAIYYNTATANHLLAVAFFQHVFMFQKFGMNRKKCLLYQANQATFFTI